MENSLTAATGLATGYGYITMLFAIVILILAYIESRSQTRMAISIVLGLFLLFISTYIFIQIASEEQVRTGGGILLTFAGTSMILIFGIKQYAAITTPKRATGLVASVFMIVFVLPPLLTQGVSLLEDFQQQYREQDLKDIEAEGAEYYISHEGATVSVSLRNPTDGELNIRLAHTYQVYGVSIKRQEKVVDIEPDSSTSVEMSFPAEETYQPQGKENAIECEDVDEYGLEDFEYKYECDYRSDGANPYTHTVYITWDQEYGPSSGLIDW
jgi:hypothetical protein